MKEIQNELKASAVTFFVARAEVFFGLQLAKWTELRESSADEEDKVYWQKMIDQAWEQWNLAVIQAYPNNKSMLDLTAEAVDFHTHNVNPLYKKWGTR